MSYLAMPTSGRYWRQQLTERMILALGALRGIREHDWIMGGDTALCRHCLHVVPVVPINAEGDWLAGTVFCNSTPGWSLATVVDRITAAYEEFTRTGQHERELAEIN